MVMLAGIVLLSIVVILCILGALCVIDARYYLLPNELVMGFLSASLVFHTALAFHFLTPQDMILGGAIGLLFLYSIKKVTERIYNRETLGLGDVKLMGAAGVLLGPDYILPAITLGALCGLLHGAGYILLFKYKNGVYPLIHSLMLPAGPGFIVGIFLCAVYAFHTFPQTLIGFFP